jgi:DnaJ homolog subfamily A member 5
VEQDWQKLDMAGLEDELEWAVAEGENLEQWECVACAKSFKSEAAWDSHERSKKHLKQVETLRRELQEDEELSLAAEEPPLVDDIDERVAEATSVNSSPFAPIIETLRESPGIPDSDAQPRPEIAENDTEVDLGVIENSHGIADGASVTHAETPQIEEMSKRDKRRAKQAKKASEGQNNAQVCPRSFSYLFHLTPFSNRTKDVTSASNNSKRERNYSLMSIRLAMHSLHLMRQRRKGPRKK